MTSVHGCLLRLSLPPSLPPLSLVEHKPDMSETDPKALFQQQIPQTFLTLQERLREKVRELKAEDKSPIMEHSVFVSTFKHLFEDEDELMEAVYFLNLQGMHLVVCVCLRLINCPLSQYPLNMAF